MFKKMKYLFLIMCFIIFPFISGCAITITKDNVGPISNIIGKATGSVVNVSGLTDQTKEAIVTIITSIDNYLPANNITCEEAWQPIIETEITKLINNGKLAEKYSVITFKACLTVAKGVDYLYKKYPTIKNYRDLTIIAINNFIEGFTNVITSTGFATVYSSEYQKEYEQAVKYLQQ